MNERFHSVETRWDEKVHGRVVPRSRVQTILRQIPTMYGVRMRKMDSDGPVENTFVDGLSVIPGVGRNSKGYDLPYDMSYSGELSLK